MNATIDTCPVSMPWVEEDDFKEIIRLSGDHKEFPFDYADFKLETLNLVTKHLRAGRPVQLITIRPTEFLPWLSERGLQNTLASRLRYVEYVATFQSRNGRPSGAARDA
jgi:hypothetical protein